MSLRSLSWLSTSLTGVRISLITAVILGSISWSQRSLEARSMKSIEFMSYNVENLFDAIDDPETQDEEFTPGGKLKWTPAKSEWKVQKVAEVIKESTEHGLRCPDILSLVEIENQFMIKELRDRGLADCGYTVTIAEAKSNDPRGIRVAILSRLPLVSKPTTIVPYAGARSTIEAHFNLGGRSLVVFSNHWKSRRVMGNSQDNGETKRRAAARAVLARIEQLKEENPQLEFIVTGDLNDEPENASISHDMRVTYKPLEEITEGFEFWDPSIELKRFLDLPQFIELDANDREALFRKIRGTYYYGREKAFNQLDHILLSASLFDEEGIRYHAHSFEVVRRKGFVTNTGGPLPFNPSLTPPAALQREFPNDPSFDDSAFDSEMDADGDADIEMGPSGPIENPTSQGASDHFPIRLRLDYEDLP